MPRPKVIDLDPDAVDPDGLSDGVSTAVVQVLLTGALTSGADLDGLADGNSSAGTSVTLDGALTGGGAYLDDTNSPRHIHIVDLGGDAQTGATYTITGTDGNGQPLVEAITGPAASGFVITTGRFASVSAIAIASPVAGSTVDIGVNGVFISADGLAHRLNLIDTGADVQTGATYTITGTGADGEAQTEDRAGPGSGATVETLKYFLTVTSITIASPVATSTTDIGTVDEVQSTVIPLDFYSAEGATVAVDVTGTIDFTVEETFDSVLDLSGPQVNATWFDIAALADKTADTRSVAARNATGLKVTVNSYSATAELQATIIQTRISG